MSLMRTAFVAGWALLLAAAAAQAEDIQDQERIIEHQLDTTESRVLRRSGRPIEKQQLQRDLGATEQRLRTFKTEHPNASNTPLYERHLDRLNRPARIREPGPPTLLDQAPTLLERR
jgi:hypothetical protein